MRKGRKNAIRLAALLLLAALLAALSPAAAAAGDEAEEIIDGVLDFERRAAGVSDTQAWVDGALTRQAGTGSEWLVIALRQYDASLRFDGYAAALGTYLTGREVPQAATRQRYALALLAARAPEHPYIRATLADSLGAQGVMSWIFGLHLVNNGCASPTLTARDITDALRERQLADGGWAVSGEVSDPDVTAMALQALAPRLAGDAALTAAAERALDFLSRAQRENGAYQSYGVENAESCAQVLTALCALGIDARADARFLKEGGGVLDALRRFRLDDGSFRHTTQGAYSAMATAQAFYAAVALRRAQAGLGPLFVLDDAAAGRAPSPAAGYRLWVCLGILAAVLLGALLLFLAGKRQWKNYGFLLLLGALAVAFTLLTDFRSAADYYAPPSPAVGEAGGSVTLSIRCDTVAGQGDARYIPADGVILPETDFTVPAGETVYGLLVRAAREYGIQIENDGSAALAYISGIHYLYEFDFGELSGWVYLVNGTRPSVGCGAYVLAPGDVVAWRYTCALGEDLDGTEATP